MFGIGTPEVFMVLLVALIVLGPKRLPKLARTLGRGMRELRRAMHSLETLADDLPDDEKTVTPPKRPPLEPAAAPSNSIISDAADDRAGGGD